MKTAQTVNRESTELVILSRSWRCIPSPESLDGQSSHWASRIFFVANEMQFALRMTFADLRVDSRFLFVALLCAFILLLAACRVESQRPSAWGIVALDPATGDVGVAAAGCSDIPLDYRASLEPDFGAGLALGVISPLQRDRLGEWIQEPATAQTIVARLKLPSNDGQADTRQYAVVTLQKGSVDAASFTGADTAQPNKAIQDAANGIGVIGTGLVSQDVANASANAYRDTSVGSVAFSDRLMRALEAGSQAGGVQACNQNGTSQTASSAFLIVARHGKPYFAVQTQGGTASNEPQPPQLALSVTEPIGGRNALLNLRQQYDAWRSQNLPACADCNLAAIPVPPGGNRTEPADAWLQANGLWVVSAFIFGVALLTMVWFTLRPHSGHSQHVSDSA
jgi:hypothetical protein